MFLFWSSGDVCLGSKAKEDHLLACFVAYMQWAPQIYLKIANTCWSLGGQNDRPIPFPNLLFFMQFQTVSARSQSDTYPTELPTRQGLPIFQEFLYAQLLFRYFEYSINSDPTPYLKDMKSSSLANVMILLESSFGTGNKYFSMLFTCSK